MATEYRYIISDADGTNKWMYYDDEQKLAAALMRLFNKGFNDLRVTRELDELD